MNTLPPTTIEATPPATADDLCIISIAFVHPREHPRVSVVGHDNPHLLLVLASGLQWALERDQLVAGGVGSSGDLCDGIIQFETRRREDTLKLILEWRDRMPDAKYFSSVAWKNAVVSTWRIVAHGAIQIQFEDFLAPERAQARADIMERMKQALAAIPRDFPIIPPPPSQQ